MEIFSTLIGNEDIKNTLGSAVLRGEFSHAYIIEGAYGTGKHTVARLFASAIMCKSKTKLPCMECNFCHKIMNDICVDVRFFDAFKVDEIREIKKTLYESSTECDYKVYIFNDAHKMNEKAQNALLISLEEPPQNVVFLLLCDDASALLETIRSRAQLLRMKPLSDEEILSYIKRNENTTLSDEELKEVIISSGGSLGYTLDMLDEEKSAELIETRRTVNSFVEALLLGGVSSYTTITSLFSMQRDSLKELLALSLAAIRDMAVVKKDKSARLCFYSSREELLKLCHGQSLKKILNIYDAVSRACEDLNSNSNVPNTLSSLMITVKKGS